MLWAHREVNTYVAVLATSIEGTFHQMLFHRGTCSVIILMELQQALGQFSV